MTDKKVSDPRSILYGLTEGRRSTQLSDPEADALAELRSRGVTPEGWRISQDSPALSARAILTLVNSGIETLSDLNIWTDLAGVGSVEQIHTYIEAGVTDGRDAYFWIKGAGIATPQRIRALLAAGVVDGVDACCWMDLQGITDCKQILALLNAGVRDIGDAMARLENGDDLLDLIE